MYNLLENKILLVVTIADQVEQSIENILQTNGYNIVRVNFGGATHKVLQIMIERLDDQQITIDDCVTVHHLVSTLLDVNDLIQERYTLEVSSAGLDRPLSKSKDFQRFIGKKVMARTTLIVHERKKFCGEISIADDEYVTLLLDEPLGDGNKEVKLPFAWIRSANLVVDL